jgi:broad specificity polyphosphatase/5'/3'-nucleotidase SurE
MVNAWSLLYDELNMADQSPHAEDEYFQQLDDKFQNYLDNVNTVNVNMPRMQEPESQKIKPKWKYHEDLTIKEIEDYITRTYSAHYSSKIQTLDLIESVGDAEAFCRSNILKYASRYDKKGSAKMDIMKIIHYAILLYHFSGQNNEIETPYETF